MMTFLKSPHYLLFFAIASLLLGQSCMESEPLTPRALFAKNFHPYPNVLIDLESSDLKKTPLTKTFLAYRYKDFKNALKFSNQIADLTEDDPVQLYRGVCQIILGDTEKAMYTMEPLAKQKGEFQDAARWYLALAALRLDRIDTAEFYLEQLTDESTYIRNEAFVLLEKVKRCGMVKGMS